MDLALLIINIILWVILALGTLCGLLKNFKKSINSLISTIISIVITFILANVLAEVLVNVEVGSLFGLPANLTLDGVIVHLLQEQGISSELIASFSKQTAIALIRLPLYLVIYLIMFIIFKPIITTILNLVLPIPAFKKTLVTRLASMGLSFVRVFLVLWFLTFPLVGLCGIAKDVLVSVKEIENSSQTVEFSQDDAYKLLDGVTKMSSVKFLAFFDEDVKIQKDTLGSLIEIKTENGRINITKEIDALKVAINIYSNFESDNINSLFKYLNDNKEIVKKTFKESNLINTILPITIEVGQSKTDELSSINIYNINWSNLKIELVDLLFEIINLVDEYNIDVKNIKDLPSKDNFGTIFAKLGEIIDSKNEIKTLALGTLNTFIETFILELAPDAKDVVQIFDLSKLNIKEDFSIIGNVINKVMKLTKAENVFNESDAASSLITDIFSISTIKGHEDKVFNFVVNTLDLKEVFEKVDLEINTSISNWDKEIKNISDIIKYLFEISKEANQTNLENMDLIDVLKTSINSSYMKPLVNSLMESSIISGIPDLIVKFMNDLLIDSSVVTTTKKITKPDLSNDDWKEEINNLLDLVVDIKSYNLLDDSIDTSINSLTKEEIESILKGINNSLLLRQILPDMVSNIFPFEDAKTEWLTSQVGVDSLNQNNEVKDKASWDLEIVHISGLVEQYKKYDFNTLELTSMESNDLDVFKVFLKDLNKLNCLSLDFICKYINETLSNSNISISDVSIKDLNSNGTKDEWELEIDSLISVIKDINELGVISSNIVKEKHVITGRLLDTMKTSNIFGGSTFNEIVVYILDTANLLKPGSSYGFITKNDALNVSWATYNWTEELSVLRHFDTTQNQSDELIKELANSQIIKDYFDIASIINDKIQDQKITISSYTINLKDHINNGNEFTNEELRNKDWAKEIDNLNYVIELFESNPTPSNFKAGIQELINRSDDTYAYHTALSIKTELQNYTIGSSNLWDNI